LTFLIQNGNSGTKGYQNLILLEGIMTVAENQGVRYTLKEAGDQLGYAVSTMRDKIRKHKIAAIKDEPNGKIFITGAEIKRYCAERDNSDMPPASVAPVFEVIDKTRQTQIRPATQPAAAAQPVKQDIQEHYSIGGL
jgi:ligand-binding sensor domain-containing protein